MQVIFRTYLYGLRMHIVFKIYCKKLKTSITETAILVHAWNTIQYRPTNSKCVEYS